MIVAARTVDVIFAYNKINLLTFDTFPLILVQIRIVFQTVQYEYGNFAATIKKILKSFCYAAIPQQMDSCFYISFTKCT